MVGKFGKVSHLYYAGLDPPSLKNKVTSAAIRSWIMQFQAGFVSFACYSFSSYLLEKLQTRIIDEYKR